MISNKSIHMSNEEFREYGYGVIDWIVDYYDNIENYSVKSNVKPGEVISNFQKDPPVDGESIKFLLEDIDRLIIPGITHWQSPKFFGYFPANTSGPSILADLISSSLGVNGMVWETSPACTELEIHVLDWLAQMLLLPEHFLSDNNGGGVIQDTASSASLCALIAAREKKTKGKSNLFGSKENLVAYASSETHSSIEKAAMIAGIGSKNIRKIDVNDDFSMNTDLLTKQIIKDIKEGYSPFFVCATIGTTSSNAIDSLYKIGKVSNQYKLWMHVDAAMAGTAAICPEYRYMHKGLEYAESYLFNPHKWMLTNFDCSCLFIKNKKDLISALSIMPEYLKTDTSNKDDVIDYRDWQIPLGRRFRSLKLWAVIRYYGVNGLQNYIRNHIALTHKFLSWVINDENFEVIAPAPLNLVCFRAKGSNKLNERLLRFINNSGEIFITHTKLNDLYTLRFCVGQTHTDIEHIKLAWESIKNGLKKIKE